MKKNPSIEEIHSMVAEIDPAVKKNSKEWKAYVFLLCAAFVGTSAVKIQEYSGLSKTSVSIFSALAGRNGIFKDGKIHSDWLGKDGGIALACDVAVLMGYLQRSNA